MTTTEPEQPTVPVSEWLSAFVPLGRCGEESWSPAGAGVLIVDSPVIWIVTAKSLVRAAGDQPIAAFLCHGEGGSIVDLTESQSHHDLHWIEHTDLDIAASMFPVNPDWELKAFSQQQCVPAEELRPLLPVCSVGCPYESMPAARPEPFLLVGALAHLSGALLHSTAPLLAANVGGPLILASGTGGPVKLAGILTRALLAPQADSRLAPQQLSEAVCMEAVWELVRGEDALAQRKLAVGQE